MNVGLVIAQQRALDCRRNVLRRGKTSVQKHGDIDHALGFQEPDCRRRCAPQFRRAELFGRAAAYQQQTPGLRPRSLVDQRHLERFGGNFA